MSFVTSEDGATERPHAQHGCSSPDCVLCPFGVVFSTLRQTKPEVMEHLMKAGFELFQAFKAVVDQHAERWEQAERLQRIPIL
ncbi:MAG: DUF5304 family protein [Actinomycetota bacterium]